LDTPYSVHRGLYGPDGYRSSTSSTKFGAICDKSLSVVHGRTTVALPGNGRRSTTKCTEPVAPSSGFPTDRRRSDCRSGSHQPRTLRTRCIAHSREVVAARQGIDNGTCRKLRSFLFTTAMLRLAVCALAAPGEEKRPDPRVRPQEFAEPGTLSSTFPTNLPLPRSAPRGASSYRRPVLGAGRNLGDRTSPRKGVGHRKFSQIPQTVQGFGATRPRSRRLQGSCAIGGSALAESPILRDWLAH